MVRYQPPTDWQEWVEWLAAGLHARNRWRLTLVIMGIVFARGRRTVTSWLRAVGITTKFADYYYFLQPVGRKAKDLGERLFMILLLRLVDEERVLLAVDDSPTKRYGPHVQGAGIHHNPTPGPADQKYLYGHIWVTISLILRHPLWNTIGLPLIGLLYVRKKDVPKIPAKHNWRFQTKLELAVQQTLRFAQLAIGAGKRVGIIFDGAYAKTPVLRPLVAAGLTVISRLRKDAALFDLPPQVKPTRGRPRKYGKNRIYLRRRATHRSGWNTIECLVYGERVTKKVKTFLATYRPVGGIIRVVIVKEEDHFEYFFCTNPNVTPREIVETFGDRAAIEQDFHDVKEVWGAGQQQVRNIWTNIATFNLNLWVHTLVECWAWHKPVDEIRDRSDSPWDDENRRPTQTAVKRCAARRCKTNIRGSYLRTVNHQ